MLEPEVGAPRTGGKRGRDERGVAAGHGVDQLTNAANRRQRHVLRWLHDVAVRKRCRCVAQRQVVERRPEVVRGHRRHGIDRCHAPAQHSAKRRKAAVLCVEIRGVVAQIDEPLIRGTVGITANLGHRDRATDVRVARFIRHRGPRRDRRRDTARQVRRDGGHPKASSLHDERVVGRRPRAAVNNRVRVVAAIDVAQKVGDRQRRGTRAARASLVEQLHEKTIVRRDGIRGKLHDRAGDGGVVEPPVYADRLGGGGGRGRDIGQRAHDRHGERQPGLEHLERPERPAAGCRSRRHGGPASVHVLKVHALRLDIPHGSAPGNFPEQSLRPAPPRSTFRPVRFAVPRR